MDSPLRIAISLRFFLSLIYFKFDLRHNPILQNKRSFININATTLAVILHYVND